jgi:hypothetical protein
MYHRQKVSGRERKQVKNGLKAESECKLASKCKCHERK